MDSPAAHVVALNQEIVAYYDSCEIDYRIVWHLKKHMCMHYGYWEADTKRLRQALHLMNCKLAEFARIEPTDTVLDAGCGVGGSAIFLAQNQGCRVHGISLSGKQVRTARMNADHHGVGHQVAFDRQDFLATSFPDASFDVVWGVESVCHAPDKKDFLREAYRLLKPGGRLIVADFFRIPMAPNSDEYALIQRWARAWAVPDYAVVEEFEAAMEAVGLHTRITRDATANVLPTIKRLYHAFFPGIVITTVLQFLGIRTKRQTTNTWSTYFQYKAFKQGLWRYYIVTAVK